MAEHLNITSQPCSSASASIKTRTSSTIGTAKTETLNSRRSTELKEEPPVPGLPVLDLESTIIKQEEAIILYRELLEKLKRSEQEASDAYTGMSNGITEHTVTLKKLQSDLNDIFMRIRKLRDHFKSKYPKVFEYVQSLHSKEEEEDEYANIDDNVSLECKNGGSIL